MISFLATNSTSAVFIPVISTILTAVTLAVFRWGWFAIQKNLNEGREELRGNLQRIEVQTTRTNGRVAKIEESEMLLRERVALLEGQVNLLSGFVKPPSAGGG